MTTGSKHRKSETIRVDGRIEGKGSATDDALVGIRVLPGVDEDHLAGSILRARKAGHDVVVCACGDVGEAVLTFADELSVPVLYTDSNRLDAADALVPHAREAGYPGVLWQADPASRVDFKASVDALQASNRYATEVTSVCSEPSGGVDSTSQEGIVVGIPAYNEEVGIGSVVVEANQYADEVVVVDDGSSDRTVQVADRSGATVIEHAENRGKGAALRTLFDGVELDGGDVLVTIDGDGQHVPAEIEDVAEPVQEDDADIVIGSRYLDGDDETPLYRRFGQTVLDTVTPGGANGDLSDTQSGFRAFSPTAVEKMAIRTDGMGVESEMISEASENGLDITEVPIDVRYDGIDGQTHNPLRHGLEVLNFIIKLIRDRHPLVFFALPGVVLSLLGSIVGFDAVIIYQNQGVFYPTKVMVAGFATILGILSIFTGLTLNQFQNMMHSMAEGE